MPWRRPGVYAPVVMAGDKPISILTGKDMTHFFRSLFEGIILVERIEHAADRTDRPGFS